MRRVPYFDDFVHKQYRRGVNRLPFYTDEADYNTNAKSYYDYLARFNNYLGLLSDFVNDLADKIDGLDDRLDKIEDKLDDLADGLQKIINNLYDSGAITSKDPSDFKFKNDRDIATGNINVFTNKPDDDWFIRTQNGKQENDVTIGYE